MNFGIFTKSVDDARIEYDRVFGAEGDCFFRLFELLRQVEIQNDIKFTDILIKQNRPVFVGIVKTFFSLKSILDTLGFTHNLNEGCRQLLTGFDGLAISSFVQRYYSTVYKEDQQVELKHFNFSLNIYGLGSYRINYSHNDDGKTLNIRILDFLVPELDDVLQTSDINAYAKTRVKNFYEGLLKKQHIMLNNKSINLTGIKSGGLIIHAGPTGSGKSTFIASEMLYFAEKINGLIITYEDPIEYRFIDYPKVLQVEINKHLNPAEIYKHFLRNSPSVGVLTEVRTKEEFLQAVDLASRGHLIFTTLHANNVKEVLSTFSTFDRDIRQQFANTLLAVFCHKLHIREDGKIQPKMEILLNDGVNFSSVASLIVDGDIVKLSNLLYKDRGYRDFYPFVE